MPNSKISDLTSATTPLAGTETLPVVQSSTTTKVSVANLTAGRAVSGTSFAVTGNTAPANGVYLPNTNILGFATNSTGNVFVDASGNLLIGSASNNTGLGASPAFVITSATRTDGTGVYPANQAIIDTRAYNSTGPQPGGGISFGYKYNVGGSIALGSSIQGYKENSTDGDYASGIRILTRANGSSPAETVLIKSNKDVSLSSGNLVIATNGKGVTTSSSIPLGFGTNTTTTAMTLNTSGSLSIFKATTAAAPAYVVGAMYFDTTLNKLRIGGAAGWETVTSV